jgi:hypothetical protein
VEIPNLGGDTIALCDGMFDIRSMRVHLAGDTDAAGRMECQRCGVQLLPPSLTAANMRGLSR